MYLHALKVKLYVSNPFTMSSEANHCRILSGQPVHIPIKEKMAFAEPLSIGTQIYNSQRFIFFLSL